MSPHDSELFRTALVLYDDGRAEQAAPTLVLLAQRYRADAEAQDAAGMSLLESGQTASAVPFLERSLRLRHGRSAIERNLALAYLKLDRAKEASAMLGPLAEAASSDFELWFALGQSYSTLKQPLDAARAYQHAAKVATDSSSQSMPALLYDWALALEAADEPSSALGVLKRVPSADQDAQVVALRAEAEERLGQFEPALNDYRRAAEIDGSENNIRNYGEDLLRHWTFVPAASIFEYGLKKYPSSEVLKRDLGITYFGSNNFARAGDIFGGLLKQHPEDASLAELLGRSCDAQAAQSSTECQQLPEFARAHPTNAPAALYAAIALLQQPSSDTTYSQAETLLSSALHADPKLAEAWYEMGVLQQARNQWALSADSFEHALSLKTDFPEAHYRLSRAYAHIGRSQEAQEQLRLQRDSAEADKLAQNERLKGVLTFLTDTH